MTNVLQHIDATLSRLCACGCETPLPPDGPSAWFADPQCQHRWHERNATDPDAVTKRPDAALVYPRQDARPVPLAEPGSGWTDSVLVLVPYWCPECGWVGRPAEVSASQRPLVCTGCGRPVPQTLTFVVRPGRDSVLLEVRQRDQDGIEHAQRIGLSDYDLRRASDPDEIIESVFVRLQRRLHHSMQQRQVAP